jgi:predicted YcjX-like family ATPase
METKLVNYKLPVDLIEQIEGLSTGNKTALVISLLKQAIHLRSVREEVRIDMYEAAKKSRLDLGLDFSVRELRSLIDGLHI